MIESIFRGMYPYFGVFAILVILWRIATKRWTKAETLILLCFVVHTLGQIAQIVIADGKWEVPRRYFLPASPLLFIWAAYGIAVIIRRYQRIFRIHKNILITATVFLSLLLIYDGFASALKGMYSKRKRGEGALVAAAVPVIRDDYQGISQETPPVHKLMYRSPYRPVVWSDFPAIGLFAGGRAEPSPFEDKPDYWILRAEETPPPNALRLSEINAQGYRYIIYKAISQ